VLGHSGQCSQFLVWKDGCLEWQEICGLNEITGDTVRTCEVTRNRVTVKYSYTRSRGRKHNVTIHSWQARADQRQSLGLSLRQRCCRRWTFYLIFFFCSLSSFFCSPLLSFLYPSFHTCLLHLFNFFSPWFSTSSCINLFLLNLLKPTGHVMHQQFNIQQLYALPTLYFCVLYLSENTQRLVPLTA